MADKGWRVTQEILDTTEALKLTDGKAASDAFLAAIRNGKTREEAVRAARDAAKTSFYLVSLR